MKRDGGGGGGGLGLVAIRWYDRCFVCSRTPSSDWVAHLPLDSAGKASSRRGCTDKSPREVVFTIGIPL